MRIFFVFLLLMTVSFASAAAEPAAGSQMGDCLLPKPRITFNLPPLLVYESDNPVTGKQDHLRILGPLFESYRKADGSSMKAFRPVWSMESKADGRFASDIVWPLSIYRKTRSGSYFWLLPYFGSAGKNDSYERYLFPFWFLERHKNGEYSWFFFPFYGDMHNFFSYQRIQFILFPLYKYGEKNHVAGNGFLWPLFNMEHGPGMKGFRIFPFYAKRTVDGMRENVSWLWPLLNTAQSLKDPEDFAFLSIPLGGYESWNGITNLTVLPPLFSYKTFQDRQMALSVLWPLFKYGKDLDDGGGSCLYFWPFWGKAVSDHAYYSFFLWPMGLNLKSETASRRTLWRAFLPLYLNRSVYDMKKGKEVSTYTHLWPFVSRRTEGRNSRIHGLDFIPVKQLGFAERNYAAFWRFFEVNRNENGMAFEILWGLSKGYRTVDGGGFSVGPFYSQDRPHAGKSEYDILSGLVNIRNQAGITRFRLFYCLDFSL